uniref:L-2-amino-thiazoline-4-carboxylic acid hydrolase n=1 Tax=Desulfovibrio sp. U5L TaxID=596152 RepID=I2Q0T8_9BACT
MDEEKRGPDVTLLAKRRIEAAVLADVYAVLVGRLGREAALAVIEETVARAAREAGKAFAASAPEGPSLQHFAAVADQWRRGGALAIDNKRQEADSLSFDVVRCCYAEAYREMGLPEELVTRISCLRDQAFVAGYSPRLHLDRPTTIASGATHCPFTFTWEDA